MTPRKTRACCLRLHAHRQLTPIRLSEASRSRSPPFPPVHPRTPAVLPFEYGVPASARKTGQQAAVWTGIGTAGALKGMSQQPEMPSSMLALSPAPLPGPAGDFASDTSAPSESGTAGAAHPEPHSPQRIPRWLERLELFLRVMLRMYIGLAVCYAPWSHTFWDQNPIFLQFPNLSVFAAHGAVRGIVSGLGLLNLWIAFHDAVRHRDG